MNFFYNNKLYRILFILFVFLGFDFDYNQSFAIDKNQDLFTLEDAIEIGLEFSPQVKSFESAYDASLGLEKQAGSWNNPNLSIQAENVAGSGRYSGSKQAEYTYSISKSIDINKKRFVKKNAATEIKKAAYIDYDISRLNIIRDIYIAYMKVISETEILKLTDEQKLLAKQILETVSKRVNIARESEIQEIKATVAYESAIIIANQQKQKLNIAKQNLAKLIGKDSIKNSLEHENFLNIKAPDTIIYYQEKLADSPFLKRFSHLSKEKEFNLDLEKAKIISDPTFKIGIKEFKAVNEQALIASLSIPLPIFNRNQGNIHQASAKLNQARNDKIQAKLALEQNLIQEWGNWQMSYQSITRFRDDILPTAKKALNIAQEGYEKGKFTFLEVLDAQRTLFDAKIKYYESLKQYHNAKANVDLITTSINNSKYLKK